MHDNIVREATFVRASIDRVKFNRLNYEERNPQDDYETNNNGGHYDDIMANKTLSYFED